MVLFWDEQGLLEQWKDGRRMEEWNDGRMKKNSCELRVRGEEVLRCCCAAVHWVTRVARIYWVCWVNKG